MKKTFTLCFILTAFISKADLWTQRANFGGGNRGSAVGFSIGSFGYIGSGFDGANDVGDFWKFDPALNSWTQVASFATANREAAVCFEAGGKGYFATGTTYMDDLWEYDPVANSWTQKTNFGGPARYGAAAFSLGGKGYVGTGNVSAGSLTDDFWEYDPATNAWTQKATVPGGQRMWAVGFAIGSYGYIGTGLSMVTGKLNDLQQYDPVSNSWTAKANFAGVIRDIAVGFSIGSKGYIGTGRDANSNELSDFWEYDPVINNWIMKATVPGLARYWSVGFSIGSKGYIGTGIPGFTTPISDFYEYTPDTSAIQPPFASLAVSDSLFCEGTCVDFTDFTTNNPVMWLWSFPGSLTPSSMQQHPTGICYTQAGIYGVTLISCNAGGCDTMVMPAYITVLPNPVATVTLSQDTLYASPEASYQWFSIDSGLLAGAVNSYFVVQQTGNYFVVVTDSAGCTDTSSVIPYITSVHETVSNPFFTTAPNPFTTNLTFSTDGAVRQADITIRNMYGAVVWWAKGQSKFPMTVDLQFLSTGIYLLEWDLNGEKMVKKIVKE